LDKITNTVVSQNRSLKILIRMPAFNEGQNTSASVNKSKKYADGVIVYYDGSTDDTSELAKTADATVIKSSKNTGYGSAILALFQAAREWNADIIDTLVLMVYISP